MKNLYLFNNTAKREIASIYRSDLSLIISEAEMDILKNRFKVDESLLHYVPFMLEEILEDTIKGLPKFEERQHFITIGNFLHEPNYNAFLYLKDTIWPLVRKQFPEAELHIYGAYTSSKVNLYHNEKEGFLIKGFTDNVNEVMQTARVCLAPIRFGAGLKGKLMDAMQNGTPIITTTIGAEGIFGNFQPSGFVEDNLELFAGKAVELYNDKKLWNEKQNRGFRVVNKRFNKVDILNKLHTIIEGLRLQLHGKRLNNFTGQMLQHHTMQTTKYMSKWIEEKNT